MRCGAPRSSWPDRLKGRPPRASQQTSSRRPRCYEWRGGAYAVTNLEGPRTVSGRTSTAASGTSAVTTDTGTSTSSVAAIAAKVSPSIVSVVVQSAGSGDERVGDEVVAIGNPLGVEGTVTSGIPIDHVKQVLSGLGVTL